jgi:hygromycin-B 7''-O-kinase
MLPTITTSEEYTEVYRNSTLCTEAAITICARHGLPVDQLRRYSNGSTIVFAIGTERVLKIFSPMFQRNYENECLVLNHINSSLPIRTPRLMEADHWDGWPYVIMEQLPGVDMCDAWDTMTIEVQTGICTTIGEATAALHSIPVEGLESITPDWAEFVRQQIEGCVERQRSRGVEEQWLKQIPEFLEKLKAELVRPFPPVLLHTELMGDHILVRQTEDGWAVSGLIDFEPSTVGAAEYEFASAGLFVSSGNPLLLRTLVVCLGLVVWVFCGGVVGGLLGFGLLHRYSNLRWYLNILPAPHATTLDDLARTWWAL